MGEGELWALFCMVAGTKANPCDAGGAAYSSQGGEGTLVSESCLPCEW